MGVGGIAILLASITPAPDSSMCDFFHQSKGEVAHAFDSGASLKKKNLACD